MRLLPAAGFGRNVTVLAGGTAFAQAIAVLVSPILTRLYDPADFGALAVYTSMIGILGALAAFSYHQAIPLPEGDEDAAGILVLSVILTVILAGLAAVVMVFLGEELVLYLGAPALLPWLWMVPLGVLGLSCYEVLTQWAIRRKRFSIIAHTAVARAVGQSGTQVGLGFAGLNPFGLLLGQLLGQWIGGGALSRAAWIEDRRALLSVTPKRMLEAAHRYRRFPQFTTPAVLLNSTSVMAPPLILSFFFGGTITGLFALGARLLQMPVHLIAKSASQVFLASAADASRRGILGEEVHRLFVRVLRISVPFVLLLALVAPDLFSVVFGSQWRDAGVYTQWLTPWLFLVFIATPLTPLVSVLERQRAGMLFQVLLMIVRLSGLLTGGLLGQPLVAIGLFGIGSAACWLGYLLWLLRLGGADLNWIVAQGKGPLGVGLLSSVPVLVAKSLHGGPVLVTSVFLACCAVVVWSLLRVPNDS